ncbi:hypothetical protein EGW08_012407, partial [Elysia chlorotica]
SGASPDLSNYLRTRESGTKKGKSHNPTGRRVKQTFRHHFFHDRLSKDSSIFGFYLHCSARIAGPRQLIFRTELFQSKSNNSTMKLLHVTIALAILVATVFTTAQESHLQGMNDNERNLIRIIHLLENVGRRRR